MSPYRPQEDVKSRPLQLHPISKIITTIITTTHAGEIPFSTTIISGAFSRKTSTEGPSQDQVFIEPDNYPPPRPDLPIIPLEEVVEHADEGSMWFTFRGGVYDMTFFLQGHPGGAPVGIIRRCDIGLHSILIGILFSPLIIDRD